MEVLTNWHLFQNQLIKEILIAENIWEIISFKCPSAVAKCFWGLKNTCYFSRNFLKCSSFCIFFLIILNHRKSYIISKKKKIILVTFVMVTKLWNCEFLSFYVYWIQIYAMLQIISHIFFYLLINHFELNLNSFHYNVRNKEWILWDSKRPIFVFSLDKPISNELKMLEIEWLRITELGTLG